MIDSLNQINISQYLTVAYQYLVCPGVLKDGLSPSKKTLFICFNDSPPKMMKNVFYFILKALFVIKIFKFLSWLFDHVEKTT